MTQTLERWLAIERHHQSTLVTHDDGTIDMFEDLARRSEPLVDPDSGPFLPRWNPHSAFTPHAPDFEGLPEDLAHELRVYGVRWSTFMILNDRIWLWFLLGQIGESSEMSSWPYDWSLSIRKWVRSGYVEQRPFYDFERVDGPELREHLTRLNGIGWVVWSDADDRFT